MEQDKFEKRFLELQVAATQRSWKYGVRNNDEIWENIGANPHDQLFTELAELYLQSTNFQRQAIYSYCGKQIDYLENVWCFIRRIGVFVQSQEDIKWLEIGLASALLDGGRADYRDLIVSLVLLRFIAEKHKINTKPIFDRFIRLADENMKGIFLNAQDHSKAGISNWVGIFGHPDWKEIKTDNQKKLPFWQGWVDFLHRK
jgi:hypothetical protein